MKSRWMLGLGLAAWAFTGCSGANPQQQLGPEHAATAGSALAATAEGALAFYSFDAAQGPLDAAGVSLTSATCHTIIGGRTDQDQDQVPEDIRVSFNCHVVNGNVSADLTGAQWMKDPNDNDAGFGFQAGKEDLDFHLESPNGTLDTLENTTVTGSHNGSTYSLALSSSIDLQSTTAQGAHHFAAAQTLAVDADLATGTTSIDGNWEVTADAGHAAATLATAPSVHLSPGCAAGRHIDGGAVEATWEDQGTQTLRVEWLGCGNIVMQFNGETVQPD